MVTIQFRYFLLAVAVCGACFLNARHGDGILAGALLGTGIGAAVGGSEGAFAGMMTGLTVGATAEVLNHHDDCYNCHHVTYVHDDYPSYSSLERNVENLEHELRKAHKDCRRLKQELGYKDNEIYHLRRKVARLERELDGEHTSSSYGSGFMFSTHSFSR